MTHCRVLLLLSVAAALLLGDRCWAAETPPEQAEFFERRVRPVFEQVCAQCHAKGTESEGGLRIESREHLLAGGDRGPAIVPGEPHESLLIAALRHDPDSDLQMPPDEKLSDQQIQDLVEWIAMGAPWTEPLKSSAGIAYWGGEITEEDRQYWAFQPIRDPAPPEVENADWPTSPIDFFVLQRLEANGLAPAVAADKRTLLRRVTFDLIGLPPSEEEIEQFLSDESSDAFARLVDRLLASPHYGERWGRHWLDVMGFAETNGLDNDHEKPNAFQYRDYVIEAFNDDVPYDVFIREHFAGDLMPEPRASRDGATWRSPQATAFAWMGEMLNVPVDERATLAREMETQIDVISKGFLGVTLACARCHNHKFDPFPTEDYYALLGFLENTTNVQACVDTPQRRDEIKAGQRRIAELVDEIAAITSRPEVARRLVDARLEEAGRIKDYLLACRELALSETGEVSAARLSEVASRYGLEPGRLEAWYEAVDTAAERADPLLYPWEELFRFPDERFDRRGQATIERLAEWTRAFDDWSHTTVYADFEDSTWGEWIAEGEAFADGPARGGMPELVGCQGQGFASSFRATNALTGRLRSPRFKVEKQYLTFLIAGGDYERRTCLNVIFNSQVLPEAEDVTVTGENSHRMVRKSLNLEQFRDREVLIEIVDEEVGPWGHIVVDQLAFTDVEPPPVDWVRSNTVVLESIADAQAPVEIAEAYQAAIVKVLQDWRDALDRAIAAAEHETTSPALPAKWTDVDREDIRLWALSDDGLLATVPAVSLLSDEDQAGLATLRDELNRAERELPRSSLAIVSADVASQNSHVHLQGDPHSLAAEVPRGFPRVLADDEPPKIESGSGREHLAEWIASADNPLTARVLVNRVWQHHFGRGLVGTPDNFGRLGEAPTHPELLDFLASRFIESGWSIKELHRLMLVSSTYRQSSLPAAEALEIDPENMLLHHIPARRLEAECIRDAMLAVAGNLDPTLYGPSIPVHLTEFDEGEDLPPVSGPLDGAGRRSIYLEVRRNHLTALLLTFDFPKPFTTVGERVSSQVPAQALALMNNELVALQAETWARGEIARSGDVDQRIGRMYVRALTRPPTEGELAACRDFLAAQQRRYEQIDSAADEAETRSWADLAHAIFNLREFIFVH